MNPTPKQFASALLAKHGQPQPGMTPSKIAEICAAWNPNKPGVDAPAGRSQTKADLRTAYRTVYGKPPPANMTRRDLIAAMKPTAPTSTKRTAPATTAPTPTTAARARIEAEARRVDQQVEASDAALADYELERQNQHKRILVRDRRRNMATNDRVFGPDKPTKPVKPKATKATPAATTLAPAQRWPTLAKYAAMTDAKERQPFWAKNRHAILKEFQDQQNQRRAK